MTNPQPHQLPRQLPRAEDVTEIDLGDLYVKVVTVTDENRQSLVNLALSAYLGERCKFCGKTYETLDDLKDTVWAGQHEHGRLACQSCWDAHKATSHD